MQRKQQARLDTLTRILSFLDDYAIELGNVSRSPSRVELDALVTNLMRHGRAQAAARGEYRLCKPRRKALRRELFTRHLWPIAAIARAELGETAIAAALRPPGIATGDDLLLERAEAIGGQAAKHRKMFLRHGLARDFVKQMRAVVDAMDRLVDERSSCLDAHYAVTVALADGFRRSVKVVSILNALVGSRLGANSALRAEWDSARRGEAIGALRDPSVADAA